MATKNPVTASKSTESNSLSQYQQMLKAQLAVQRAQWKHENKVAQRQRKNEAAMQAKDLATQQTDLATQRAADEKAAADKVVQEGLTATTGGALKSLNLGTSNTIKSPISGTAPLVGMPGFRPAASGASAALPTLPTGAPVGTVPTLNTLIPSLNVPGTSTTLAPGIITNPMNPLSLTPAQQRKNANGIQRLQASVLPSLSRPLKSNLMR